MTTPCRAGVRGHRGSELTNKLAAVLNEKPHFRADDVVRCVTTPRSISLGAMTKVTILTVAELLRAWGVRWIGDLDMVCAPSFEIRTFRVAWAGETAGLADFQLRNRMNLQNDVAVGLLNECELYVNGKEAARRRQSIWWWYNDYGFLPLTPPVESPQSNRMAEAFVRTFKRDYVAVNPKPDANAVIRALPNWFEHCSELRPHRAVSFRARVHRRKVNHKACGPVSDIQGQQHEGKNP